MLEKKSGREGLPNNCVSVAKTSIAFGHNFTEVLEHNGYVEVHLDRIEKKIGFNPTRSNISGYKIQFDKGGKKRACLTSSKVAKMIPRGRYNAYIDSNGYIVIAVEEIIDTYDRKEDIIRV